MRSLFVAVQQGAGDVEQVSDVASAVLAGIATDAATSTVRSDVISAAAVRALEAAGFGAAAACYDQVRRERRRRRHLWAELAAASSSSAVPSGPADDNAGADR
ncbi:MAG: hypothetical protein AAF628_04225 [Planctomycetota bacterium]